MGWLWLWVCVTKMETPEGNVSHELPPDGDFLREFPRKAEEGKAKNWGRQRMNVTRAGGPRPPEGPAVVQLQTLTAHHDQCSISFVPGWCLSSHWVTEPNLQWWQLRLSIWGHWPAPALAGKGVAEMSDTQALPCLREVQGGEQWSGTGAAPRGEKAPVKSRNVRAGRLCLPPCMDRDPEAQRHYRPHLNCLH